MIISSQNLHFLFLAFVILLLNEAEQDLLQNLGFLVSLLQFKHLHIEVILRFELRMSGYKAEVFPSKLYHQNGGMSFPPVRN